MRRATLLLLVLLAVLVAVVVVQPTHRSSAKGNPTRIVAGPGIAHAVALPYPDGELETLAASAVPVAAPAEVPADAVELWSEAWMPLLGLPADQLSVPADRLSANYAPSLGLLTVRATGGPRWFALASGPRSTLDRYVRLARAGALPEQPSLIDVYLAERRVFGEPIPIAVGLGGRVLSRFEAAAFWSFVEQSPAAELRPADVGSGAGNFMRGRAGTWPIDYSRDRRVFLEYPDGRRETWTLLVDRGFLTLPRDGLPSWSGYAASPALRAFIESQPVPPFGVRPAGAMPWLVVLAALAAVGAAGSLGVAMVRQR